MLAPQSLYLTYGTVYYALLSRPQGPMRCPARGNAEGALVFLGKFYTVHSVSIVNYVTTVTTFTTFTTVTTCTLG